MNTRLLSTQRILERMGERPMDNRHMSALFGCAKGLLSAVEALADLHANRDPYLSPASNDKRIAEASRRLALKADAALGELNDHARAGVTEIEATIQKKANLIPTGYAAEIRAVFRSMDADSAQGFLRKAVESGDAETITALCCAPYSVTGIEPQMASRFRQFHEERSAPEECRQRGDLMDALSEAVMAVQLAREASTEFLNPEALRRAEEAAKRNEEAAAKVAQAVGP